MSRKAGKRSGRTEPRTAPEPAERVRVRGRGTLFIGLGLVAVAAIVLWRVRGPESRELPAFPPPPNVALAPGPTIDEFVGAEACGQCHNVQYAAWQGSTHGQAGGLPSPATVIAPFNGSPIRFQDAQVVPEVRGGEYRFRVRRNDGSDEIIYRVDGVIGRGHMVGGGTQGFVSAFPDGTMRFLPFDYSRTDASWFCNTATRSSEGWVPITPEMKLADCGDWPPTRILGTDARFSNCQECHGSQITVQFDSSSRQYQTHVGSFAINCESCHGPGRRHVDLAQSGALGENVDIGIRTFGTVSVDSSLELCFQCHALKTVTNPGYLGREIDRYYSTKLSLIGDEPLHPDGRIRTFAYQGNHLSSDCYLSGSMTCVDCHDPHSSNYRDIYGRELASRFDDGQCLSCHPSKGADISEHTHHLVGSSGSTCVSCHMPYLQHPELGDGVTFARSDHTIPIPRPAFDQELGIENACGQCHGDRSTTELQEQTERWYGILKPHKDLVRGLLTVGSGTDRREAAELLLRPDQRNPMAQMMALDRFLSSYLAPNLATVEPAIVDRLLRLADHDDLDVRSVALATLHYAWGDHADVRGELVQRLTSMSPEEDQLVRDRWVVTLGYYGDRARSQGDGGSAIVIYRKALEVLPQHAGVLGQLADTYGQMGQLDLAVEYFTRALDIDPNQPLVWVNLGVALERGDRMDEAARAYRRALEVNPGEPLAQFNLGNYHVRRSEYDLAIAYYREAVRLDPGLALGHANLARALLLTERFEEALAAAERALEFQPNDENTREMVRRLREALGQ